MSQEVMADALGDEFKGYVLRITGGNDVRLVVYTFILGGIRGDDGLLINILALCHLANLSLQLTICLSLLTTQQIIPIPSITSHFNYFKIAPNRNKVSP